MLDQLMMWLIWNDSFDYQLTKMWRMWTMQMETKDLMDGDCHVLDDVN